MIPVDSVSDILSLGNQLEAVGEEYVAPSVILGGVENG